MVRMTTVVTGLVALLVLAGCGGQPVASGPPTAQPGTASTSAPSSTAPSSADSDPAATAPEPVVRGNLLVDARTGQTWVPKGVNWSSFEYACAQGWGYSALDTLGTDGAAQEARIMASWGIDTVRLPLNQDCWLGTRGAPVGDSTQTRTAAGYQAAVTGFVQALRARGIVTILDLQSRKRPTSPEFGNLAMPDADSLRFWTSVAGAFRDDPSVMYDAFNEPYSRYDASGKLVFDLSWSCWRDGGCRPPAVDDGLAVTGQTYTAVGMTAVVGAIRSAGAHQPILLGGLDYANDLSQWSAYAPHDDQLIAALHAYDFKACTASCWTSVIAPLAAKVPVITSELGANDPTGSGKAFVSSYLDFADAHGIGALFWAWGDDPKDPMALTTDLFGHPTAYGRLAQAWLKR